MSRHFVRTAFVLWLSLDIPPRQGASIRRFVVIRSEPERHLVPLWPPQITVIELETGDELGTFETEAEAAACLAPTGLRID